MDIGNRRTAPNDTVRVNVHNQNLKCKVTEFDMLCSVLIGVNPLIPNNNIHILLNFLHIFLMVLVCGDHFL